MRNLIKLMVLLILVEPLTNDTYKITFTDGHTRIITASYCEKEYGNTLLECFRSYGDDEECIGGWMLNTIKSIEPIRKQGRS